MDRFNMRGGEFIVAVCKKLEIDPTNVRQVVISAIAGDVVRIHIVHFGTKAIADVDYLEGDFKITTEGIDVNRKKGE